MADPKTTDRSRSKLVLDGVPSKRWWKFLLKAAGWLTPRRPEDACVRTYRMMFAITAATMPLVMPTSTASLPDWT